jgi:hypothetical protein
MKNWIASLTLVHLALFAGPGQAAPLTEDFDYVAGAGLASQNGGTGWLGPWSAADTFSVAAGSLSYPGLSSVGNRGVYRATNFASSGATRTIGMGAGGTTLWMSFLMSVDGNPDGLVSDVLFAPSSGNYLRIGKVGAADNFWSVRRDGSAEILSTTPIVPGAAALFVMRFDFNADPTADDTVSIYIDPQAGAVPGAPVATYANNNFSSLFTSIQWEGLMGDFNAVPGAGTANLDRFRSGASYADVGPAATTNPSSVPEPSSAILAALGLALLGRRAARTKKLSRA